LSKAAKFLKGGNLLLNIQEHSTLGLLDSGGHFWWTFLFYVNNRKRY